MEKLDKDDIKYLKDRMGVLENARDGYLIGEAMPDKLRMAEIFKKLTDKERKNNLNCGGCVISMYKELLKIITERGNFKWKKRKTEREERGEG